MRDYLARLLDNACAVVMVTMGVTYGLYVRATLRKEKD